MLPDINQAFWSARSIVTTNKEGFILRSMAFSENIYDDYSLSQSLADAEFSTDIKIKKCFVDKGYKGHGINGHTKVFISGNRKKMSTSEKKQLKRRSSIEATISHMKSEGLLAKSYLKGVKGNEINAILWGLGHNIRLILKKLMLFLLYFIFCIFMKKIKK